MLTTLTDPLILLILALLLAQSLFYLLGGLRALRQDSLSQHTQARVRRELLEWGLVDTKQHTLPADSQAILRAWARLIAQGRVGMGAGILCAVALLLALLSIPGSADLLSNAGPPLFLAALLLLQAFYLGMFTGQTVAFARELSRLARSAPAEQETSSAPPGKLSQYRSRQVALLPGGLLVGDVLLLGLVDLFTRPALPASEVWSLMILPAAMLLICIGGEYAARRIARLPALRLGSDAGLARLADKRLRAHLIGMLLELEVFGLFILVGSQWMLRAFAPTSSSLGTAALLVYGVIILSLRGLLDRAQRERATQPQQAG
jgi:hypothetical protein